MPYQGNFEMADSIRAYVSDNFYDNIYALTPYESNVMVHGV
jgi:hypothetical protein